MSTTITANAEDMGEELTQSEEYQRTAGWPDALRKAVCDPFDYALELRNGLILFFESAAPCANPAWVRLHLRGVDYQLAARQRVLPPFPRGLEVQVADIVWVTDAPYGS